MNICHRHNLVEPEGPPDADRRFGIRVTLPQGDTFRSILGDDWEQFHWYVTEDERDKAFAQMAARHGYYRMTDTPTQVLEKIRR